MPTEVWALFATSKPNMTSVFLFTQRLYLPHTLSVDNFVSTLHAAGHDGVPLLGAAAADG
jgi:hypothetical protein